MQSHELIDFWRRCPLDAAPYVHPEDRRALRDTDYTRFFDDGKIKIYDEFVKGSRFGKFDDHRFHSSLLPIPYGGDITRADIIILLLNPGFNYTDYYGEMQMLEYKERLTLNLRQSFDNVDFPFLWLDPKFCWHGGFNYWEGKLRKVLIKISTTEEFRGDYLKAMQSLSRRIAQVELVPYHSAAFNGHALLNKHLLPSVKLVKQYVNEVLVPLAKKGEKTVIVTRQNASWKLNESDDINNIIVYEGSMTRGASLGPESRGGQAILRKYGIFDAK